MFEKARLKTKMREKRVNNRMGLNMPMQNKLELLSPIGLTKLDKIFSVVSSPISSFMNGTTYQKSPIKTIRNDKYAWPYNS